MTGDPACDWDCHDAMVRMGNALFAASRTCGECPYHRAPPEGKYGWCEQMGDFEDSEMPMRQCDYWEERC